MSWPATTFTQALVTSTAAIPWFSCSLADAGANNQAARAVKHQHMLVLGSSAPQPALSKCLTCFTQHEQAKCNYSGVWFGVFIFSAQLDKRLPHRISIPVTTKSQHRTF